ncbi:MAG TPA: prepilin-type N-terminal cleavage/methylation domain-containing protein [Gallionella sp.]|nr:prepilin-type N-terminal cleavage/methylation domain-containing protein [Gallionella sp.]
MRIQETGLRFEVRGLRKASTRIEARGEPSALPLPLLSPQSSALGPRYSVLSPKSSRGFTLLELIVVIIIIVTLMGLFMNRALFYMEQAEKVAMEGVAGAIQSSLTMQYGQILTRGKSSDVAVLVQNNPMNWLQKKPRNYAGEFYGPTPLSVEPGNWMFDLKSRDLVYVVRNANYFKPGKDGQKWIRFHIAVSHETSRPPSMQNAPPELTGILFEPTEPYSWF